MSTGHFGLLKQWAGSVDRMDRQKGDRVSVRKTLKEMSVEKSIMNCHFKIRVEVCECRR